MGAWRIMPLLSTLAALVIIVHSAEEEDLGRGLEREYRFDMRPRVLDTGTPYFNEPWRAESERHAVEPYLHLDEIQNSQEEPLKRRRPVRKRKRRPQSPEEPIHEVKSLFIEPSETVHLYADPPENMNMEPARFPELDEPLRYRKTEYNEETTELPRRRRRRPDNRRNRSEPYLDADRPLRRRGQRRKRPQIDPQKLGEQKEFTIHEYPTGIIIDTNEKPNQYSNGPKEASTNDNNRYNTYPATDVTTETTEEFMTTDTIMEKHKEQEMQLNNDRSLSDFSLEIPTAGKNSQLQETNYNLIDPMALKEILKRSNGASLSEILQQHNLSLSDLLRGKEDAISALKSEEPLDKRRDNKLTEKEEPQSHEINHKDNISNKQIQAVTEPIFDNNDSIQPMETATDRVNDLETQSFVKEHTQKNEEKQNLPKISTKRRFPTARRKLRMRPGMNSTYKSQLNRDLMAQVARKYHTNRNVTKLKEWRDVVLMINATDKIEETNDNQTLQTPTTTNIPPETTTVVQNTEYYNPTTIPTDLQTDTNDDTDNDDDEKDNKETTQTYETTTQETTTMELATTTEKPKTLRLKPAASRVGLRRQAFNNRLKRKRMKQKNVTTESTVEKFMVDLFGMPNLVSSSEFIARTTSKSNNGYSEDVDFTTLDDFMTTEKSKHSESGPRFTRNTTVSYSENDYPGTTFENDFKTTTSKFSSTTEETAKFEIEEILNDTRTSARLSRILMERNMTLNELVEHRERGSSHVHLADIFHNASKEPNPPEPFLSKSSIEPISKETYPLRAILEANLHESAVKATTIDPIVLQTQFLNIPVVMDFGNNVNENGENMGIMSLFNKFTENEIGVAEKSSIGKDSEGTPYVTTVITLNNTNTDDTRESRDLKDVENLKHDIVGWNELFELMRRNHQHEGNEVTTHATGLSATKSLMEAENVLPHDLDGDGLIALEDLQRPKEFESGINSASDEKLEIGSYEKINVPHKPGILDRAPSNTRSVTVATASILGLAMILFLLTYAAFKWKQQRSLLRKKQDFSDERIPTPVFENRKGHKNNCSTRSISPMLASSNIYTMNTLESSTGKESPDYMWDSLRKPFQ